MILCFMIPCCILWYRIYSCVCLYCVVSIIIIRVRFMQSPCMLSVVWFTVCLLACLACALQSCDQQNDRESSACARGLNSTGSRGLSARTFWKSYSERCLSSYCWVVSRLCIDTLWNFSATLPRNGTLLFNVGHLSERVVSTWTLLLIVRHLLEACCIVVDAGVQRGPSARRSPGVSWNVNGSGRVVPFHLISIAERGHAVRTVHRVTSHRFSSKSECVDPRQKIVIRR